MKTRFLSLGLIFVMIISLAGCSGKTEEAETSEDVVETEEATVISDAEEETDEETSLESKIVFDSASTFSEGLAWIYFEYDGDYYNGVINKSGELIFALSGSVKRFGTDFSNGYAYIETSSSYEVVNTEGEIVAVYDEDDYNDTCYGGGYFVTEEYSADFYSTSYVYTIYSPEGDVVWTYESETECRMSYDEDSGVFSCGDETYAADVNDYSEYPESSDSVRTINVEEGADGYDYVVLYDSSGSQVSDPILMVNFYEKYVDSYCIYSGYRLIMDVLESNSVPATITDVYVYDENGNFLYSLFEKGYTDISVYKDGAVLVSNYHYSIGLDYAGLDIMENDGGSYFLLLADGEEPVYLDLNGDPLFDSIDMSAFYELYE